MPTLKPGPSERELQKLIALFLKAETDIINEIGRLRSLGLVDYHAEAALARVQAILRRLESDCWEYVPRMIETQFYVSHPEARKPLQAPERMTLQVHSGSHGQPKYHFLGKHGEHAHDFSYDDSGKFMSRKERELTDEERIENGDIL